MTLLQDLPSFGFWVDGRQMPSVVGRAALSVRIQRRVCAPALCEVTFLVDTFAAPAQIGQAFAVRNDLDGVEMFSGTVTACSFCMEGDGARLIHLRAHDALDRLRQSDRAQSFADQTSGEIIVQLTAAHGLTAQIDTRADTARGAGLRWPAVTQVGQSDLEMLRLVCARSDLWFDLHKDVVRVWSPDLDPDPLALPTPRVIDLSPATLTLDVRTNAVAHRPGVARQAWDIGSGSVTGSQDKTALDPGLAQQGRTDSGAGGLAPDKAAAQVQAQAAQRRADHAAQGVRLKVLGDIGLGLGAHIVVADRDRRLNVPMPVAASTLTLDGETGLQTEVSTDLPPVPKGIAGQSLWPATVTSVADPEQLGRVQVTLDTGQEVKTGWLRVVLPGAGADRGLVALPDRGDRVVLLQTGATPDEAVVLGGVIGPKRREMGVDGRGIGQMMWTSADGQTITLDDSDHALTIRARHGATLHLSPDETRIAHRNGSHVTMTGSKTVLHSKTDLTLEAPGQKMVIGARSVDFQKR